MAEKNPPERKLAKRTSVQCGNISFCIIHMIHIYKWRGGGTIYVFCNDIIELSMIYVMLNANANAILKARYSAQSTC